MLPVISEKVDSHDPGICFGLAADDGPAGIAAAIVNKNQLIVVIMALKKINCAVNCRSNNMLTVEYRNNRTVFENLVFFFATDVWISLNGPGQY